MRGRKLVRDYDLEAARKDLDCAVHFGVVAARMGVTEDELATYFDAGEVADWIAAYMVEAR